MSYADVFQVAVVNEMALHADVELEARQPSPGRVVLILGQAVEVYGRIRPGDWPMKYLPLIDCWI